MDIHRCRFVPYPPSAINALAFSHSSSKNGKGKGPETLRLAVGRANGDIEIWNPLKGAWFHETTFRGGKDRSIEGLVWTQDPDEIDANGFALPGKLRLFSIGYSTAVTEWDLEKGVPVRHSSGNYGEVWCIAAQPASQATGGRDGKKGGVSSTGDNEQQPQNLAVGCADGSVVVLSTADNDLRFQSILSRSSSKKARVLSIAFQNRHTVVAGFADSMIRVYDIRNGSLIRNMPFGGGPKGGPREILVWSVKCLPSGDIVSGDSAGEVRFWDGKNYSLLQKMKSHRADVLSLATSIDGETVISGGMDRRSTVYRRTAGSKGGDRRRWAEIAHRRLHAHDVKAMATFETKNMSVVASGGLDTTPIIIPLREFGKEYHQTISSLPQTPQLGSAPAKRCLMSWWDREVSIWKVQGNPSIPRPEDITFDEGEVQNHKLIAKILVKGEENITSAALSMNCDLLAISTTAGVKVFRLRSRRADQLEGLRVQKLNVVDKLSALGAKSVCFSPDCRWLLVVALDNSITVMRVVRKEGDIDILPSMTQLPRLERSSERASKIALNGSLGDYERFITRLAFSSDSRILVVGDLSGYLDSWVLEGYEDLTQEIDKDDDRGSTSSDDEDEDDDGKPRVIFGQHWIRNPSAALLPRLPSAPLLLSFRPSDPSSSRPQSNGSTAIHATRNNPRPHSHDLPSGEDRLIALTSEHQLLEFKVLEGKISDWSRRNPTAMLPKEFRLIRERAMGGLWDVSMARTRLWIHGTNWLGMFDLSRDFPHPGDSTKETTAVVPVNTSERKRKRKRETINGEDLRKDTTGAGSKVPDSEMRGVGRKLRKVIGVEPNNEEWTSLDGPPSPDSGDDDDLAPEDATLSRLRRGSGDADDETDGQGDGPTEEGGAEINGTDVVLRGKAKNPPTWWYTYKYRPILGIVPLGGDDDENVSPHEGEQAITIQSDDSVRVRPLEVALVERPMWDVELPPRFYGDQEWDK
ncbi:MAG: hypothetical protein M1819_002979 [Sarea resinae]|nr:MAG: hypothetical protein M1819_002979 [Sarea resinae]